MPAITNITLRTVSGSDVLLYARLGVSYTDTGLAMGIGVFYGPTSGGLPEELPFELGGGGVETYSMGEAGRAISLASTMASTSHAGRGEQERAVSISGGPVETDQGAWAERPAWLESIALASTNKRTGDVLFSANVSAAITGTFDYTHIPTIHYDESPSPVTPTMQFQIITHNDIVEDVAIDMLTNVLSTGLFGFGELVSLNLTGKMGRLGKKKGFQGFHIVP